MVNLMHYVPKFEDFHLVREAILVTNLSSSEESSHFYEQDESGYVREEYFDTKDDGICSRNGVIKSEDSPSGM